MTAPLVSLRALRVSLPNRAAKPMFGPAPLLEIVKGVDLDVARGAALGLVGESGSGKTTLGRTLVGLVKPTGGKLFYDGTDITDAGEAEFRPLRAKIQMIFQDPQSSLNPRLTIGSILTRPLTVFGKFDGAEGRRKRARELVEIVGLPDAVLNRYPNELSGGQRQRVGIARALALEPEFIVADEIVSGLDVSTQAQILLLLRSLREEFKLTLLFIAHDLSVVRVLCDYVAVMSAGEIVEQGDTATVFASPQHLYTRELLDSVPLPDVEDGWINARAADPVGTETVES
jgi:peptide/nickel transport system ATP-binding protein